MAVTIGTWFGVLAPARTPRDVQARLSPEFRKRMDDIGAEPVGNTPEQMARPIKDDTEKFARLVKQAGVVID